MLKLDKSKLILLYYRKYVEEERNLTQREIQYEDVDIEDELKLCEEIEKAYKYKECKQFCNEYEQEHKQKIKYKSRLTEGIWWDFVPNEEDPIDFQTPTWENDEFGNSIIEGTCPQDYMDDDDDYERVEISEPTYVYDSDYAQL